MSRGSKCPNCEKYQGVSKRGLNHCGNCGAIWWRAFDEPSAGSKGRGETCNSCGKLTMHDIGTVGSALVLRCSTCAATIVKPGQSVRQMPRSADRLSKSHALDPEAVRTHTYVSPEAAVLPSR
jgi:hypothetical protein